jgi:hypothetical protein
VHPDERSCRLEQFDTWVAKSLEKSGVPLLYVLRKEHDVLEADPGLVPTKSQGGHFLEGTTL